MNRKLNILNPFGRTAICIILVLLTGIGFSFGSAAANRCDGGGDCPVCAELPHGHVPGTGVDMRGPGCVSDGQNSSCGFEAGQDPDKFHSIVSSARSYHQSHAGIFAPVSAQFGQPLLPKNLIPQILLADSCGASPIYLLNQSLLC